MVRLKIPCFNLSKIYNSFQCPHWIKLNSKAFIIRNGKKSMYVEQQKSLRDYNSFYTTFNCTSEDFYNHWFEYFDLGHNYSQDYADLQACGGKVGKLSKYMEGVHIIKQNRFESFLITNVTVDFGYDKALKAINHVVNVCGKSAARYTELQGKISYKLFPDAKQILRNKNNLCRMGKFNDWLINYCEDWLLGGNYQIKYNNVLHEAYHLRNKNIFPDIAVKDTVFKNFGLTVKEFTEFELKEGVNRPLFYASLLGFMNQSKLIQAENRIKFTKHY